VVVDDGSTDETGKIGEEAGARVIRHPHNQGYGASIKTGVRESIYDHICIIDADGTYPCVAIPLLLERMEKESADMIIGARPWNKIPIGRRPAKFVIHRIAESLVHRKILDLNSGLRVFLKKQFNRQISVLPDGFSLTSSITLIFLTEGYKISYIPVDYYERAGKSKIHPIKDTLRFLRLILRTILYGDPLSLFLPFSLLLLILGGLLAIAQAIFFEDIGSISFFLISSGIQILAIGLLADLVNHRLRR